MTGNSKLMISKYTYNDDTKIGVGVAHEADDYYVQIFESKKEIEDFITKLRTKGKEVFGD